MSLVSLVAASYYRRKKQIKSIAAAATVTLMRGEKKAPVVQLATCSMQQHQRGNSFPVLTGDQLTH